MKQNLYHKRFINSFASENVIALFSRYKNASKEITESWAMLEAVKGMIQNSSNVLAVVIGDGCSPRTGALLAYYTKADVISIDPQFNVGHLEEHKSKQLKMGYPIERLQLYRKRIENLTIECESKVCAVVFPHSHANMLDVSLINARRVMFFAMPCCEPIPAPLMRIKHLTYEDENVLSPKRTMHIWDELDLGKLGIPRQDKARAVIPSLKLAI